MTFHKQYQLFLIFLLTIGWGHVAAQVNINVTGSASIKLDGSVNLITKGDVEIYTFVKITKIAD